MVRERHWHSVGDLQRKKVIPPLYSIGDFAKRIGVSRQALYDRKRRGTLIEPYDTIAGIDMWTDEQIQEQIKRDEERMIELKKIRKYDHGNRVEYYANSLEDIAQIIDAEHRKEFIEKGIAEYEITEPVYGVKEFYVLVYPDEVIGSLITHSEGIKEFYRKG